jgi:hypothetical protein
MVHVARIWWRQTGKESQGKEAAATRAGQRRRDRREASASFRQADQQKVGELRNNLYPPALFYPYLPAYRSSLVKKCLVQVFSVFRAGRPKPIRFALNDCGERIGSPKL